MIAPAASPDEPKQPALLPPAREQEPKGKSEQASRPLEAPKRTRSEPRKAEAGQLSSRELEAPSRKLSKDDSTMEPRRSGSARSSRKLNCS